MSDLPHDHAGCRQRLLKRLQEPAPGHIQLLTGPRRVGKTTLLLEIAQQFAEAAVYAAGDEPDAALPGFWDVAGLKLRRERETERLSCSSMKFTAWATGPVGSRGSGSFSAAGACLCMSSPPDLPPCAWPPDRARAWRGVSNA
jgi:hypothetical protein